MFAKREIEKIDSGAALMWVHSDFRNGSANEESEEIRFIFLMSSGSRVQVTLRDSNPPQLIGVDENFDYSSNPPEPSELLRYSELASHISLGPRDIWRQIVRVCKDSFTEEADLISINLFLDRFLAEESTDQPTRPSSWGAACYFRQIGKVVIAQVSAHDGEILRKVTEDLDKVNFPSPSTSSTP
ncbi:MAG: hypothetical protein M3441_05920 [Chloroflexota bacterium]|nr:hypothetical protein [Chloroflexota bacterium]